MAPRDLLLDTSLDIGGVHRSCAGRRTRPLQERTIAILIKSVRNGLSVQVYPTGEAFFANGTKVEGGFENLLAAEGEDQGAKADADVAPLGATMAALQNNANAESESDKA